MKNYSELSDFEINSAVHNATMTNPYKIEFLGNNKIRWIRGETDAITDMVPYGKTTLRDYCNNPLDAWPIIVEEKISIMFDSTLPEYEGEYHEWCSAISSCQNYGIQYQSNPLRAAMIVYLMMKESE